MEYEEPKQSTVVTNQTAARQMSTNQHCDFGAMAVGQKVELLRSVSGGQVYVTCERIINDGKLGIKVSSELNTREHMFMTIPLKASLEAETLQKTPENLLCRKHWKLPMMLI